MIKSCFASLLRNPCSLSTLPCGRNGLDVKHAGRQGSGLKFNVGVPVQATDGLFLSIRATADQISHDIDRRAVGIVDTSQLSGKSPIALRSGLLILGRQHERSFVLLEIGVIGVVFWMRNGCAKVVCQAF